MAKFPKPPKSQKAFTGKPSGTTPGKKSAMHGDNSKLGMGSVHKKGPKGK